MSAMRKIIDFVLPPRCILTGDIVDKQGMVSPQAWAELNFVTSPHCNKCGVPFDFDDGHEGNTCASCLKTPPIYDQARAALFYDEASKDLILPFKHGDKTHYVLGFLPWLKQAGDDLIEKTDYMMPVPLLRWRLIQRRYNQAGIMTSYLAKQCHKNYLLDGLLRVRATQSQGHMRVKDRQRNVKKAFAVNPKYMLSIQGKTILLIDDVYTSGATVEECAKILKKAGAAEVNVLTLARVVRPNQING